MSKLTPKQKQKKIIKNSNAKSELERNINRQNNFELRGDAKNMVTHRRRHNQCV